MNWIIYALLSAFFAALTAILAKIGIKDIDSNLATAIRTVVVLIFAWSIVFFQKTQSQITNISKYSLTFLILSGLATGLSWIFYFRALQMGQVSKVVPVDKLSLVLTVILSAIFLAENPSLLVILGSIIMSVGAIMIALG